MRKTIVLFLALIILMLSLYCTVFALTNKEKDNVVINEVFYYGDKSAADNVSVNLKSFYRENLLWDTTYRIKDNTADTDFSIYKNRIKREYEDHKTFRLFTSLLKSVSGPHTAEHYSGIEKAYSELVATAVPHVENKKTVLLSDYLDYYPIQTELSFPGKYIDELSTREIKDNDLKLVESMRDFFKIPIIEGHKIELRVTVNEEGDIYSSGTTSGTGLSEDEDNFGFNADSLVTDKECFIYFDNTTELGYKVDTSLIPGGYGIYRLPYTVKKDVTDFDYENIKNIYPIKSEYTVLDLDLSKDEKNLYLITSEENKCVFYLIDSESFETKERTVLSEDKDESVYLEYIEKDYLVFSIYHPNRESKFSVFTFDKGGNTVKEITAEKYIETSDKNGSTRYIGTDIYDNNQIKAVWNNGRLYVVNPYDNIAISQIHQNGFRVAVYGKDGMEFYGEYITSLSTGNNGYQLSAYHIYLSHEDKLNIIVS